MSNLVQRTISGTFYVAAIVLSIVLTPNFFFVLFAAVSFCAVWEFCRLLELDKWLSFWSSLSAAVAFAIRIPAIQAIHAVEWVYLLIVIFVLVAETTRSLVIQVVAQPFKASNFDSAVRLLVARILELILLFRLGSRERRSTKHKQTNNKNKPFFHINPL